MDKARALNHAMADAISANPVEIKIVTPSKGKRYALHRLHGTKSTFWHYMPVRQAETALRDGVVSIGLATNAPVVAAA